MTDPRQPIFDYARKLSLRAPGPLLDPDVAALNFELDALGAAKAPAAASQPVPVPPPSSAAPGGLTPSDACFSIIQEFEGYATALPDGGCKAYPDPATGGDPWTIGFGSTGSNVKKGTIWTRQQAEAEFDADVIRFSQDVAKAVGTAPTGQHQFDAMVSLAYNVGMGNFGSSTLLKMHKAGDFPGAADQFLRWNKANGKEMAGLTRRREAERALYLS